MKKKITLDFEPIIIYEESPRQTISDVFKKHKHLILQNLIEATNINNNTIRTELGRMVIDGLIIREKKVVLMKREEQARSMIVYSWINKRKNGRK